MIELCQVSKSFDQLKVLDHLSFKIPKGKILCILGPSGCGKTTILQIVAGLLPIDEGQILKKESIRSSYIFQEPRLLPWKTVRENIDFVLPASTHYLEEKISFYLQKTGLQGYEHYYPYQLSGGMKQRVALVRAFVYEHQLLLMDEPFQALDIKTRNILFNQTHLLWEETKNTIVFVTHQIEEALLLGDEILVLSEKPTKVKEKLEIHIPRLQRKIDAPILQDIYKKVMYSF